MFCPECGKEIGTGGGFCSNCGKKIDETAAISSPVSRTDRQNLLALIGGAILVLSFFMPWVSSWMGSISGFDLMKIADQMASGGQKFIVFIVWLIPIGGGITSYCAYTRNRKTTWIAVATGTISLLVWCLLFYGFKKNGVSTGVGFYLLLVGIVCLGISVKSIFADKFRFRT